MAHVTHNVLKRTPYSKYSRLRFVKLKLNGTRVSLFLKQPKFFEIKNVCALSIPCLDIVLQKNQLDLVYEMTTLNSLMDRATVKQNTMLHCSLVVQRLIRRPDVFGLSLTDK